MNKQKPREKFVEEITARQNLALKSLALRFVQGKTQKERKQQSN